MKAIRLFGCALLLLTGFIVYFVIRQDWPFELKLLIFAGAVLLVYIGLAALLTKTKKSFKEFVADVLGSLPWIST